MSSEGTRRAPMMSLRELVEQYRAIAGEFGTAVPLAAFGLTNAETERLFSLYDEDYHISRFFHFKEGNGSTFTINGEPATDVAIDGEVETIL